MEDFMKKSIFIALLLSSLICSLAVFAETATQVITVQTVIGKVEREVSAGKWEAVTKGMKLTPATVINTGLNSSLTILLGERVATVKAMQKGTVEKLTSGTASTKGGIKLGAKVIESDVTADPDAERTNISTASTRASAATKDVEWSEE
jgi:hypothetical protein